MPPPKISIERAAYPKLFSAANLDGDERLVNYFSWINRDDLKKLYSSEFSYAIKNSNPNFEMIKFLKNIPPNLSKLDRMLALEQQFFLADHNLLYTDRMSMAAGVEVRVPFLDNELVEFVYNIPDKFKQKGLNGKWVLKKALEGQLPKDVIYRPKTGFGAPLRQWMRHELREFLGDTLSIERLRNRGLFAAFDLQSADIRNKTIENIATEGALMLGCGNNSIRFRPHLNISKSEIDQGISMIDKALSKI